MIKIINHKTSLDSYNEGVEKVKLIDTFIAIAHTYFVRNKNNVDFPHNLSEYSDVIPHGKDLTFYRIDDCFVDGVVKTRMNRLSTLIALNDNTPYSGFVRQYADFSNLYVKYEIDQTLHKYAEHIFIGFGVGSTLWLLGPPVELMGQADFDNLQKSFERIVEEYKLVRRPPITSPLQTIIRYINKL